MVKTKSDVDIVEETQECVVEDSPSIFCLLESHNLAFLIQEIFLYLDHDSLHQARQVCQDWNEFIMERIWRSRRGKEVQTIYSIHCYGKHPFPPEKAWR